MHFVYIMLLDILDTKWEGMRIFLNDTQAIEASIGNPDYRVEIFEVDTDGSFKPSLNYYKSGIFITPYN